MTLKPWYKVVTPREDLREGKPLDASEFAVHLDHVRDGKAPDDYKRPERFLERTYLTKNLLSLASEVVRRLSSEKVETSAVFNMATQFGGGKTHALTLLYHLAQHGSKAKKWPGVKRILETAGMNTIPGAATAVFVGMEFDSITGRGGEDGTPVRKTPWGEIAYQLSGEKGLSVVAEHEKQMTAPAGDVIRKFLPKNKPSLILIDELVNYISRSRKMGMAAQMYNFLQSLSEEARARDNLVLAVSIPASELEMSAEDQSDHERFKKLLDRLGKPVIMSAEAEISEIIRRRLFEWKGLPRDAQTLATEYANWVVDHRQLLPNWFPVDHARQEFENAYPFHPMALSVFERKWQTLPRFQRTRGILRLLALWVARAYKDGYSGAHKDPLIGLGTAPLDDPIFRPPLFEQLGEEKLEAAITTDICGKKTAHSVRLDNEAVDTIKKARLHRKVATTIFFESNGGQGESKAEATVPEIRLAVGGPGLDIGNVETALEALGTSCYYLSVEGNRYRFSLKPNLNKILADRRASVKSPKIEESVRAEVQKVFAAGPGIERKYFPDKSSDVPNRPVLTFVVLPPNQSMQDRKKTLQAVEKMTKECGKSSRTFKNALIWCVADTPDALHEEARKLLAWQEIDDEQDELGLDEKQASQLKTNLKKAQRDLTECVWRTYKNLALLDKQNNLRVVDMGLIHSSAAQSLVEYILTQLRQDGEVEKAISPNFLVKHWPPAFTEWSTKSVRDAFFASPQFPRLLDPEAIKDTIATGVCNGKLAYVGKGKGGKYDPFIFEDTLSPMEVEISDDMYIITVEEAIKHKLPPKLTSIVMSPSQVQVKPGNKQTFVMKGLDQHGNDFKINKCAWTATGGAIDKDGVFAAGKDEGSFIVTATVGDISSTTTVTISKVKVEPSPPPPPPGKGALTWSGEVPTQKYMNFYTKVLSKFATDKKALKLKISIEIAPEKGLTDQQIEDTRMALRELDLNDDVTVEEKREE